MELSSQLPWKTCRPNILRFSCWDARWWDYWPTVPASPPPSCCSPSPSRPPPTCLTRPSWHRAQQTFILTSPVKHCTFLRWSWNMWGASSQPSCSPWPTLRRVLSQMDSSKEYLRNSPSQSANLYFFHALFQDLSLTVFCLPCMKPCQPLAFNSSSSRSAGAKQRCASALPAVLACIMYGQINYGRPPCTGWRVKSASRNAGRGIPQQQSSQGSAVHGSPASEQVGESMYDASFTFDIQMQSNETFSLPLPRFRLNGYNFLKLEQLIGDTKQNSAGDLFVFGKVQL